MTTNNVSNIKKMWLAISISLEQAAFRQKCAPNLRVGQSHRKFRHAIINYRQRTLGLVMCSHNKNSLFHSTGDL
jgi:hypothetical protein